MAERADAAAGTGVRGLTGLLDSAASSHRRAILLLLVVSLLALVPGIFRIPPVDRDEALFAQITKQMIETRNFVDIRYQDVDFYKKPPGINWLQSTGARAAAALGVPRALESIWVYRLPSLIGSIAAVLLTYWAALVFVPRRAALLAALMLATSLLFGVEARLARTDAPLMALFVAILGAMGRLYLRRDEDAPTGPAAFAMPALLWTSVALGILLKGPFVLLFTGLVAVTLVAIDRSFRFVWRLKPFTGILWTALIIAPWLIAIVSRTGTAFFADSIGYDTLGKVAGGQESHGAPPGYFLILFFVTFWPASVLSGLAVPPVFRARREPKTRFLLAWIVPAWLIFELVPTKLPHYVMHLYPAIAILIAGAVVAGTLYRGRWLEPGTIGFLLLPLVLTLAAPVALHLFGTSLVPLAWPFALAAIWFGFLAWWRYRRDGAEAALLRSFLSAILIGIFVFEGIIPALTRIFPAILVDRSVRTEACPAPRLASAGFEEPSLTFLMGTDTAFPDAPGAADFLKEGHCRVALVAEPGLAAFLARAAEIGIAPQRGETLDVINPSHGDRLLLTLFSLPAGAP